MISNTNTILSHLMRRLNLRINEAVNERKTFLIRKQHIDLTLYTNMQFIGLLRLKRLVLYTIFTTIAKNIY